MLPWSASRDYFSVSNITWFKMLQNSVTLQASKIRIRETIHFFEVFQYLLSDTHKVYLSYSHFTVNGISNFTSGIHWLMVSDLQRRSQEVAFTCYSFPLRLKIQSYAKMSCLIHRYIGIKVRGSDYSIDMSPVGIMPIICLI